MPSLLLLQSVAGLEAAVVTNSKRVREEADQINLQRQQDQDGIARQLYNMNRKRVELADKNLQIAVASAYLRQDLKRFKASA
jgi:Breast carcinoma amplified sequence 2 (BCAS2)